MFTPTLTERTTKYCVAIEESLGVLHHATNAELLNALKKSFPDVSATTIHRATLRLAERGKIGFAPADKAGSMRYDANVSPHDHFQCTSCDMLLDANIKDLVLPIIEETIEGCRPSGRLNISGICNTCNTKESQ